MTNLIVYCSSHGTTAKAAQLLGESLVGKVELVDLSKHKNPDLTPYDAVIIGGSIHAGMIQRKVKKFINMNHDTLLTKKTGFFLCCFREGDEAKTQFETAFPQDLRTQAVSDGIFGGEFIFSNMNFFEKQIIKKVAGVSSDQSNLDITAIKEFADRFNHAS